MSTEYLYICDKCGAELDDKRRLIIASNIADPDNDETYDLCETCYGGAMKVLKIFLSGGDVGNPTKTSNRQNEKTQVGKTKKRKTLDLGKMAALRNAGWTYEKIADELKCSSQTVANHMKEAQAFLKEHQGDYYKEEMKNE